MIGAPGQQIPPPSPSAKQSRDLHPVSLRVDELSHLWARWAVATVAGETLGFGVPAAIGALAYGLNVPESGSVPLAVAAGAGEGAILGLAQSRVLRREIDRFRPRDWIAATAAAAALGWAVGMPLGVYGRLLPTAVLIAGVIVGTIVLLTAVGGAQWLVLRRHVTSAGLWIPANALAWLLGLIVPFAGMSLVDGGHPAALILAVGIASGLGMGFVVAAVTGLALVCLLRPAPAGRPRPMRFFNRFVNPLVRALRRSPLHPLLSSSVAVVSYAGRRTGRRRSLPVMYVRDGDSLVVFAGHPERKRWWRNLRSAAPVDVHLRGRDYQGQGCLVTERGEIERGLALYLGRFPRAAKSLDIPFDQNGRPRPSALKRAAAGAVMVVIELAPTAR